MTQAKDAAEQLIKLGFAVCKPDPVEKKPTYKGWPTRSLEAIDFAEGDQVGVMGGPLSHGGKPGHALVIVDLDAPEANALADTYLPATPMMEGRASKLRSHRYYLVAVTTIPAWAKSPAPQGATAALENAGHPGPFTKSLRHRDTNAEVLRFIGTGGQAVCPPSVWTSKDGTRTESREWEGGSPGQPAVLEFLELWRAVCELASACGCEIPNVVPRPPAPVVPRAAYQGGPSVEQRAALWLAENPGAVSGQGGHAALFTAARGLVWGFDLDTDTAFRLLAEEYNPRCQPPWSERELRHKVEDADRVPYGKPRGYLRDAVRPNRGGRLAPTPVLNGTAPNGEPKPKTYPLPLKGECWDDPHRIARLFVADHRTDDGEPTLVQWRDEYHEWNGAAWLPVPDSDLDARLAKHTRAVFVADMPERQKEAETAAALAKVSSGKDVAAKEPSLPKVTSKLKSDVRVNLAGLANHPDTGNDPPFWLCGGGEVPASDVVSAPNGLFTLGDIATGGEAFSPPTPRLFTPTALPFEVPRQAENPVQWLKCLGEWFSGDERSVLGLQEWMGYFLSADTSLHKVLFLVGPKRSGKGTILSVMESLVGPTNVASTTFAALGHNFGLEALLGKRVAVIPDGRLSGRTDTAAVVERLLSISGEDTQSVDRKHRRRITTRLRTRIVVASNEVPRLPDASGALASRFHILHTPNSWFGKEDRGLKEKLRAELPGILVWAAKGWVRLREQGAFTDNDAAEQYATQLADLSSPIRAFVHEACSVGPEHTTDIPALYAAWRAWNEQRHRECGSEAMFGRDLKAACPHICVSQPRRGEYRVRVYTGIALRERKDWGGPTPPTPVLARDGTRSNLLHAWAENKIGEGESGSCNSPDRVPGWGLRRPSTTEASGSGLRSSAGASAATPWPTRTRTDSGGAMTDVLTGGGAAALFANPPLAYVLWFRPGTGRGEWEAVGTFETQFAAVSAIGIGGRRNGRWIVLPHGQEP